MEKKKKKKRGFFVGMALTMLLMLSASIVFTSLQLLLRIPMYAPVGLFLGLLFPSIFIIRKNITGACYISALVIVVLSSLVQGGIFDFSWDGQAYHQLAQIMLVDGWNPYWSEENIGRYAGDIWVHAYPKALWIYSAGVYGLSDNILMGKGYNLFLAVASYLLCYKIIHRRYAAGWKASMLFSLLITLNPIVCSQLTTYYVDGALYLLMVCFLAINYLLVHNLIHQHRMAIVTLAGIIIVLSNVRFTGAAYAVILCLTDLAVTYAVKDKHLLKRQLGTFIIGGVIGILLVGYNPYITNLVRHGNIGWPIVGGTKGNGDIISHVINPQFAGKNRFTKFAIGYGSKTSNSSSDMPQLKVPGSVSKSELQAMAACDTRIGGFGPLFSLLMIFSILGLIWLARSRSLTKRMIILLCGLLCTVFVNPECWFARYVPQLYLLPILICLWTRRLVAGKLSKVYFGIYALLLSVNLILSVVYLPVSYKVQKKGLDSVVEKLNMDYEQSHSPFYVDCTEFYSRTASVLDQNGIPYVYFDSRSAKAPLGYKKIYSDNYTVVYAKR